MDWIARLLGAFYLFAGFVVLRRVAMDRLLDQAIARISCKPPPRDEVTQSRLLLTGGCLTFASGAALVTLSAWSLALFIANALFQSGYLVWAQRRKPPENVDGQKGRRATINAWILYLIATAFVGLCALQGIFRPWTFLPESVRHPWVEPTIIAALTGLLAWRHLRAGNLNRPPRDDPEPSPEDADDDTSLSEPPLPSPGDRLRLAPEDSCWPLWNDRTGDNLDPARLPLPADLLERLMHWDAKYQAAFDPLNPAAVVFPTPEAATAFHAEGKSLANALRTVWPGGVVLILNPIHDSPDDSGHSPRNDGFTN
jgi:hypothetical protein